MVPDKSSIKSFLHLSLALKKKPLKCAHTQIERKRSRIVRFVRDPKWSPTPNDPQNRPKHDPKWSPTPNDPQIYSHATPRNHRNGMGWRLIPEDARITSLCTAAPSLKKIGKERLWFTVDNRVQRPRDFFRNVWKMIWLVISHTSLHHWNSEIWLVFIFARFAMGAFRTESFTFVRDNNMMWDFDDEFVRSLWRRHRKKHG